MPHEHRRELRALKVFGAWTNLVDMKAGNTLDTLITENGRSVVRHYLQDVGSTFGTGANGAARVRRGLGVRSSTAGCVMKRLLRFGFPTRPWQTVPYQDNVAIGRFEGDAFDPLTWKPRVPTDGVPARARRRHFWAARRVAAFSDEMIRALVRAGGYSHPEDEELLADVLIKRRDKIARTYLNAINPLVDFALSTDGRLSFENAAVDAQVAAPPRGGYTAAWATFDDDTDTASPVGAPIDGAGTALQAPAPIVAAAPGVYVKVSLAAPGAEQASWARPVDAYFRRTAAGWQLVGVDRRLPAR